MFKNLLGGYFIPLWTAGRWRFPSLRSIRLGVKDKSRHSDTRESGNRGFSPGPDDDSGSAVEFNPNRLSDTRESDNHSDFGVDLNSNRISGRDAGSEEESDFAEESDSDEDDEGDFSAFYSEDTGLRSIGTLPQVLSQALSGVLRRWL